MPSVKNNFLKGRMNKDLDDRLVPQGEYRDAKNIRISKSDTEDAGVVQNIKGTTSKLNLGLADDYEVIGHFLVKLETKLYSFLQIILATALIYTILIKIVIIY